MNQYLIFILEIIVGGVIIYFLIKKPTKLKKESLIEKQAREKTENKRKILNFIQTREKISNQDIEDLLKVSDATATRYLEELEQEGKMRQVGNRFFCF